MKKFLRILIVLSALTVFATGVKALALTPYPTASGLQQQVNELQTSIASKVAELNLVEKRGILGTVIDSSDTQITLEDINGKTRFVDVDELTKFSSPTSNSAGISDIKKGMYIGVLGLYNKQSQRILARDISIMNAFPEVIYGEIENVDRKNFELTVIKPNNQKTVIEVQDITRTYSYSGQTLLSSGFSKTGETQTVVAIGFPDKQDPAKILATRVIIFPDIQIASINLYLQTNPTIPPSTGSGRKLYPITK